MTVLAFPTEVWLILMKGRGLVKTDIRGCEVLWLEPCENWVELFEEEEDVCFSCLYPAC